MKLLRTVHFDEVLRVFNEEHSSSSTNDWTRELLVNTNKSHSGKWSLVRFSSQEARSKISLMWHHHGDAGYGRGIELIPVSGATVSQATSNFLNLSDEYAKENKKCLDTIIHHKYTPFNPVFLSIPLSRDYKIAGHESTTIPGGNYLHLDGLHRLIAWNVAGRFNPLRYLFSKKLTAYVAMN